MIRMPGAALAILLLSLSMPALAQSPTAFARVHDDASLQWGDCPEFMPAGCAIAVLHGDPAQPGADVFFRVPGGAQIPRHFHSSAERMVLVAGELEVTYDDQSPVTLRAGHYAYGPAQAPHSGRCRSPQPCVLFIAFDGPVDAIAGAPES